jgi:hypothetical protein
VEWLHDWQELVGSAAGVFGAFLAAWWAAAHASRRDRRNAAFELIEELVWFASTTEAMLDGASVKTRSSLELDKLQSAALGMAQYRPRLSPSYLQNIAALRLLDPVLVTRTASVRQAYEAANSYFDKLDQADRQMRTTKDFGYTEEAIRGMLSSAARMSRLAAVEARDTAVDLERLFVKRGWRIRLATLKLGWVQKRRLKAFQEERDQKRLREQKDRA